MVPPSTGRGSGTMLTKRQLDLLRHPHASNSQIWSWYVAARRDVKSANPELARIEAEFAKFVAAHARTDAVIEKLHAGQNEAHMHAHADANASSEANASSDVHAHNNAHTRSSTQACGKVCGTGIASHMDRGGYY